MEIVNLKITKLKQNPDNPRLIKDDKFNKLVNSIKEFPEMLNLKPIVVDEKMIILGGNMRYKACRHLHMKEVPVLVYTEEFHLTTKAYLEYGKSYEDAKKEFVIKDNVTYGDWDWDILANEWDNASLNDWALDVWQPEDIDYDPNLSPDTQYSEITREQIEKEAKKLAEQMLKESKNIEVVCPHCSEEFEVQVG